MKLTRWLPDRMIARVVGKYTERPPKQGGGIIP
jgi:hypothetical protein